MFKITSSTFRSTDDTLPDCHLDPSDPIHEFNRTGAFSPFQNLPAERSEHNRKMKLAKEQGIKPGSPAWHLL